MLLNFRRLQGGLFWPLYFDCKKYLYYNILTRWVRLTKYDLLQCISWCNLKKWKLPRNIWDLSNLCMVAATWGCHENRSCVNVNATVLYMGHIDPPCMSRCSENGCHTVKHIKPTTFQNAFQIWFVRCRWHIWKLNTKARISFLKKKSICRHSFCSCIYHVLRLEHKFMGTWHEEKKVQRIKWSWKSKKKMCVMMCPL